MKLSDIVFYVPLRVADRASRGKGQASADMWATVTFGVWGLIVAVGLIAAVALLA